VRGQYSETKLETCQIYLYNLVVRKKILPYFEEPGVEPPSIIEFKSTVTFCLFQESPVIGNKLAKLSSRINTIVCVIRRIAFCVTD
jgi:hypothetical protein